MQDDLYMNIKVGEKVLLKRGNENKYESPYQGPFEILKVNNNGTVRLTVNSVMDTYNTNNIRRLVPYVSENDANQGGECNMWISNISKKLRKN